MEITLWWWQTVYKAPHHVSTKNNWHLNKSTLRQGLQNCKVRRFLKRFKFSSFICMAENLSQPWKHRAGNIIPLTRYQSNFPILCQLSFLRHFAAQFLLPSPSKSMSNMRLPCNPCKESKQNNCSSQVLK